MYYKEVCHLCLSCFIQISTNIYFFFLWFYFHCWTGTLALSSMSLTRVFMDNDVQPTIEYFTWYVLMYSASILPKLLWSARLYLLQLMTDKWFIFCIRLGCNPDTANQVIAEVVTKRETLSITDIFSYIKQDSAKVTFKLIFLTYYESTNVYMKCLYTVAGCLFWMHATIDDVVHGSAWYYIACSGCHSKATPGPSSLICTNTKCQKVNTTGVPEYVTSP